MTPEKQRIAIAEACGWSVRDLGGDFPFILFDPSGRQRGGRWSTVEQAWLQKFYGNPKLPDYLNDLNAMHEAEKMLLTTAALRDAYQEKLEEYTRRVWSVDAEDKAGSLIWVLGFWEEETP